jgi:hypothetical protein
VRRFYSLPEIEGFCGGLRWAVWANGAVSGRGQGEIEMSRSLKKALRQKKHKNLLKCLPI